MKRTLATQLEGSRIPREPVSFAVRCPGGVHDTHVLVTGGAGFIGSHLCEALRSRGHTVSALDDLSTGRSRNLARLEGDEGFELVRGQIEDEFLVKDLVKEARLVYHLAAVVGVQEVIRDPLRVVDVNVEGTRNVLEAARPRRPRVVVASTSEVYGKGTSQTFGEGDASVIGPTTRGRWSYAATKLVDEFLGLAYHRQHGVPLVIPRLFNTAGPRQTGAYGMVIPRLVEQALKGVALTVHGDGGQTRCFLDVDDAVRALLLLGEHPRAPGEVFNVGSTEEISILDLARRIATLVDGHPPAAGRVRLVPYDEAFEPGFEDMRRRVPDIAKIQSQIGWSPSRPLDAILERVIADHRASVPVLGLWSPAR